MQAITAEVTLTAPRRIGDKAKGANDYIVANMKTGALSYDADGSGAKAAIEFAQVKRELGLTHKDFFVI
ncbi:hypothetical protein [Microvirga sp. P5_D2]